MTKVTHVMSVPLVPADAMAALKLRAAIDELRAEDPTLGVIMGPVNEIILQGMGELHLEIAFDRLKREKGLDFKIGAPQVAYRESIARTVTWFYIHEKPGSPPQDAKVRIRFEPGKPGSGFAFENALVGEAMPKDYIAAVEMGLARAAEKGVIAGFSVDIKCTLIDSDYRDLDSSVTAFDIAARACFREALPKAGPRLLEPMMKVEVVTPQEYMGDVIGDLNRRRGQVQAMDSRGNAQVITAMVPLANMFGYVTTLRSMTQGRAQYTMHFDHYEQVPPAIGPSGGDDTFPPAVGMRA